jgi:hypothetical protein
MLTPHPEKFLIAEFGKRRVDEIGLEHTELFRARLVTTPKPRKLPRRGTAGCRRRGGPLGLVPPASRPPRNPA